MNDLKIDELRIDTRVAISRYESSFAAFGNEASFTMKELRTVQEYINRLETVTDKSTNRIEQLESELVNWKSSAISLFHFVPDDITYGEIQKARHTILAALGEKTMVDTITITKTDYKYLKDRDHILSCLEACGVDNWYGWDFAIDLYEKDEKKNNEQPSI